MPSSSSTAIPTVSVDARIDAEGPGGAGIDAVDTGDARIDAEGPGNTRIDANASIDIGIDTNLTVDADTTRDALLRPPEREFPNREELVEFVC